MEDALGTKAASSSVPGGSFHKSPSGSSSGGPLPRSSSGLGAAPGAAREVTWDEMGQLGLHRALNEYYKLSATQRRMRLCRGRDGAPGLLCTLARALLTPQLPAALSPPALLAAAGWLLYAAAWLLYATAPLTIPLALWLVFAADGSTVLPPAALEAAGRLHPAAAAAAARLQQAVLPPRPAAAALLLALLLLLRLAEGAVTQRRQQRWEQQQRRVSAAALQARYATWQLPASSDAAAAAAAAAEEEQAAAAAAAAAQQQQQLRLLAGVQAEAVSLWQSVYGGDLQAANDMRSLADIAAAVAQLAKDTGVELPPAAAAAGGGDAAAAGTSAAGAASAAAAGGDAAICELLLQVMHEIKLAVGLE